MSRGVGFYNKDWFAIKEGKELLYESVIRILMTSPGERVMRPSFGVGLNKQIFATLTPDTLQDLAIALHTSLANYEKRVTIEDVQTELVEDNVIKIHIYMRYIEDPSRTEQFSLKYTF